MKHGTMNVKKKKSLVVFEGPTRSVSFKDSPLLERHEPSKTTPVRVVLMELLKTA